MKNKLLAIFQIGVTVFFIYYTLSKIGLYKILEVVKSADLLFILSASIVYFLSQIISSQRLWFILKENNLMISTMENVKLYMIGIFYNFFIPGGVGGDAYKGVLMNKKFEWSLKKIYKLLILDRLIGFGVILCLILVFSGFILNLEFILEFSFVLIPLYALLFFMGKVLVKKIFDNKIQNPYDNRDQLEDLVIPYLDELSQIPSKFSQYDEIKTYLLSKNPNQQAEFLLNNDDSSKPDYTFIMNPSDTTKDSYRKQENNEQTLLEGQAARDAFFDALKASTNFSSSPWVGDSAPTG